MGIWAEIKKAINSNLSLPLNEKIDRDIEENRIGNGFLTSTEPVIKLTSGDKVSQKAYNIGNMDSAWHINHIVLYKGLYYVLGSLTGNSYRQSYYVFSDISPEGANRVSTGTLPYYLRGGVAFVYNDYLYIMGSENNLTSFYKFDGTTWRSVMTLPFELNYGHACVYKGKVYIWNCKSTSVKVFDGSTFTDAVVVGSDTLTSGQMGRLFEKDEKLYLLVSTDGYFYYLDEQSGTFVRDSSIPPCAATASNDYPVPFVSDNGHLYVMGRISKVLENGSWVMILNDTYIRPCQGCYIIDGDTIYSGREAEWGVLQSKVNYITASVNAYLPKNTLIVFDTIGFPIDTILPVKNCTIEHNGCLRAIDDGKVIFRIAYRYTSGNIMFKSGR